MPNDKESQDIEAINKTVMSALEMLMGAGGHKAGFKGLKSSRSSALKIAKGIATDHTHRGYKDVTMQAFQRGLQRILDDYFVALKLLEGSKIDDVHILDKLSDHANCDYILKILGFTKAARKTIHLSIEGPPALNAQQIFQEINNLLVLKGQKNTEDRKQRIELMISGAMCYLPFSEPNDGHPVNIPIKDVNGHYHQQATQVERINMNPGIGGPYHALYLRPAQPAVEYTQGHVVFMGTNPLPTSSGPSITIHADTISGNSIGENFVQASEDRFEKLFKEQFKNNLKNLLENHLNDFKNTQGVVDYEKLWLAARLKCVGQSLGGSISLQMLVKFPFMVEISAFEPPFLLEKHREEMQSNLENAHVHFNQILNEIAPEIQNKQALKDLKKSFPKDSKTLHGVLKNNNIVIAQLIDFATKFGTFSPPTKILHVDTDKTAPKYSAIKDYIYKRVMAYSLLSHAMILAGQNDKKIKELDNLDELFTHKSRRRFTNVLSAVVWKAINHPMSGYIRLKNYILNHVYDPMLNPDKHPKYRETNIVILNKQLNGKWATIQQALNNLDDSNSWQTGAHVQNKMNELSRMMQRAEQLGIDTTHILSEIKSIYDSIYNSGNTDIGKKEIYLGYLMHVLYPTTNNIQQEFQEQIIQTAIIQLKSTPFSVSNITEMYVLLNDDKRRDFITELKVHIEKNGNLSEFSKLIKSLSDHAQRNSEKSSLKDLSRKHHSEEHHRRCFLPFQFFKSSSVNTIASDLEPPQPSKRRGLK
ncbi:hypothetical protein CC99x_006165 [Candidatus Berkiella cookevillensis]|uniref:Uncharacterized protein n=1 Tax=Candidatus Berkiella cookevillensis TaxID=437022 RepID=A0A0Q9YR77_9GAMM|nr:hypothetical protein [Candidatus Berkiella cookevillensis]MCS5708490.1 hypothetical protein [Candidatus Berkiella cookevillensis]